MATATVGTDGPELRSIAAIGSFLRVVAPIALSAFSELHSRARHDTVTLSLNWEAIVMTRIHMIIAAVCVLMFVGAIGVVRVTAQQQEQRPQTPQADDAPSAGQPTAPPEISTDFAEGAVELQRPDSPFDDKGVKIVTLGNKLEFECRFYIDDFFEKTIIWAGANISNPTSSPVFFEYNVAFFDEQGKLIGCAAQGSYGGVEAKESTQLGSCLIALQPEDIARVRRYQVRVYESNKEVGAQ